MHYATLVITEETYIKYENTTATRLLLFADWPELFFLANQKQAVQMLLDWFSKSKCPGAPLDVIVNFHHRHSIVLTSCPWVSEDVAAFT